MTTVENPRNGAHATDVPVRAIVMPFRDADAATALEAAVSRALAAAGVGTADVWLQDPSIYHSSLWHASHHKASLEKRFDFQLVLLAR